MTVLKNMCKSMHQVKWSSSAGTPSGAELLLHQYTFVLQMIHIFCINWLPLKTTAENSRAMATVQATKL